MVRKPLPSCANRKSRCGQLPAGGEVVEDYRHVGLTLRAHPLSFLREDLAHDEIITCTEAAGLPDGKWAETAGIVLVRQRPGSAEGVIFMTIEDETGIANVVIWPKLFEKRRRIILSASLIAVAGQLQKEGEVVHLVARQVTDLSHLLASLGHRREPRETRFSGPDVCEAAARSIGASSSPAGTIKVKARDFR